MDEAAKVQSTQRVCVHVYDYCVNQFCFESLKCVEHFANSADDFDAALGVPDGRGSIC